MQLAGYLRGRALQERKHLSSVDKTAYQTAIKAIRNSFGPR